MIGAKYVWCEPTRGQHTLYRLNGRGQTWLADVKRACKCHPTRAGEWYWSGAGGNETLTTGQVFADADDAKADCEAEYRRVYEG